jgi:hypothetical protein
MKSTRQRVAAVLIAAFGMSIMYTGTALAATQWVNDNPPVGTNTSCADPGFNDIQSAVTAAGVGDTVRVCSGVYDGQVVVPKKLIVRGAKYHQDARTRSTSGESIVRGAGAQSVGFDLQGDNIVLDGFTIRAVGNGPGVQTSPLFSGYRIENNIIQNNAFGIYANTGSAFQNNIRTNLIKNNNANLGVASAAGNGIYTDQGTNRLLVARNRMVGQRNAGFLFTNTGTIQNNDVTIQYNQAVNNTNFVNLFGNNSNFQIRSNSTNDTVPGDNASQGTAIRIADNANGIVVTSNTLSNSPFSGVAVRDAEFVSQAPDNIDINFNHILSPAGNGVDITDSVAAAVSVFQNTIRHAGLDGIFLGSATNQNFVNSNSARFSTNFDCEDQSTGTGTSGTANTWTNNVGNSADPPGICHHS